MLTLKVKNEISSITNLGATAAFTAVENKIPNVTDIAKKKKQIMMQKYQKWGINILLLLIILTSNSLDANITQKS